ncbi:MAG: hypothetical protein AAFY17_01055 [Cyanobacteria bacterium J06642_11]
MTGLLIRWGFAIPNVTVLIDRSYCPAGEWNQLVDTYRILYRQHQRRQIQIKTTVLFNTFTQEALTTPLLPDALHRLKPYGQSDARHLTDVQKAYSNGQLLSCNQ